MTKQHWRNWIYQKNVLLTLVVFCGGLIFHLTPLSLSLVVILVALVSTWWIHRTLSINLESQIICNALHTHPAVLIKDYPHVIAFQTRPSILALAYQSPVPRPLLKQTVSVVLGSVDDLHWSLGQAGVDTFLLFQIPLTPYTQVRKVIQVVQKVVSMLELNLDAPIIPAKRYRIIRLFGFHQGIRFSVQPPHQHTSPSVPRLY